MAKYRDFDDDYVYDDDRDSYDDVLKKKKNQQKTTGQKKTTTQRTVSQSRQTTGQPVNRYASLRDIPEYDETKDLKEEAVSVSGAAKTAPKSSGKKPKKKKKMKTWVKVLIFSMEILTLVVLAGVWYVVSKLDKLDYTAIDKEKIVVNQVSDNTKQVLKGYTNILLLGSDARDNSKDALLATEENHTDSIIVASINNETHEVKLVSLYRDTLLYVPESAKSSKYIYTKATEAMFYYGVESTMSMVNTNMDLDIKDYLMVNWNALIDIVDAVGGVDLEINDMELYWLNQYLVDTSVNTGRTYTKVEHSGKVHLDGIQATAYCRIRYGGGSDYRRTERQRTVISLVTAKAKQMDVGELNDAIDAIVGNVATSLKPQDIISLAAAVTQYKLNQTTGFPFELTDQVTKVPGVKATDPVIPKNLKQNVIELHKYLFGVDNYTPSTAVQKISDQIISLTGVQ